MTTPPRIQPGLSDSLGSAARIVAAVLAGRTPDATLAQTALPLRPATLDLAYTTLRDFGRGDFLLGRLLSKPLKETGIRALLLVALARLERRPEDAHTIVDQAVGAAAGIAGGRLKGLTNAVLRNFLRQRDDLLTAADADAVAHWRHPAWWLDALREVYPARWEEIAAAGNSHPPLCLRINRRRTTSADFISPPRSQTRLAAPPTGGTCLLGAARRRHNMCLAIPARVVELPSTDTAIVDLSGVRKEISLALVDGVNIGDYVIVHVGFALNKLDTDEAEKTLALFAEMSAEITAATDTPASLVSR